MKVIFVSVDGLLDPLGQSQILPYILGIRNSLREVESITILSIEKKNRLESDLGKLKARLKKSQINWEHFRETRSFCVLFFKILWLVRKIRSETEISSVFHLRGFQALLVYFLSKKKNRFIYDVRGVLGEFFESGRFLFIGLKMIMRPIDRWGLLNASHLVFLDQSAVEVSEKDYAVRLQEKSTIIPTSVDRKAFRPGSASQSFSTATLTFVYLGGAYDPYMPEVAINLVNQFAKFIDSKLRLIFINEFEVNYLIDLCKTEVSKSVVWEVVNISHKLVPHYLRNADFGIICNKPRYYRATSCPTKLGEFLASGLMVLSISGINCIDRLSQQTNQVAVISLEKLQNQGEVCQFIHNTLKCRRNKKDSQQKSYNVSAQFCLKKAIESYTKVYENLLKRG